MDPAVPESVREVLTTQGQWLRMQEEQMASVRQELADSNKRQEAAFTMFPVKWSEGRPASRGFHNASQPERIRFAHISCINSLAVV